MANLNHLVFHIASVTPDYKGDTFPPAAEHRVVSVACCLLEQNKDVSKATLQVRTLEARKVKEKELIEFFFKNLKDTPVLVSSYNLIYSIPVLTYRAMYHAVSEACNYFQNRELYDNPVDGHIDLSFLLSNGGAIRGPNFPELAQVMSLPPPDRHDVSERFAKGELGPIEAQLGLDVLVLTLSFLRYSFVCGNLDLKSYQKMGKSVLKEFAGSIPACREYLEHMNPKRFFLADK